MRRGKLKETVSTAFIICWKCFKHSLPWDDLPADTNWLLLDVVEGIWAGVGNLALNLVGPAAVVSQAASRHADIDLGHVGGLAVIERFDGGEEIKVLLEQVGELDEELSTVLRGLLPPWALEGLAGGSYGNVDILLGSLVDGASDALVRWVDNLEGLAVLRLHELVVDEAVWRSSDLFV